MVQGIWGILSSLAIRFEVASVGPFMFTESTLYNTDITAHGLIMIFFVAMPILFAALGNYYVPILLGSPEVT